MWFRIWGSTRDAVLVLERTASAVRVNIDVHMYDMISEVDIERPENLAISMLEAMVIYDHNFRNRKVIRQMLKKYQHEFEHPSQHFGPSTYGMEVKLYMTLRVQVPNNHILS